jgi:hypothetical protein
MRLPNFSVNNDEHIFNLTTRIGIYQFARKTVANKKFGYSIDDQARALILALFLFQKKKKRKYLNLAEIYLNFIQRAQRRDGYFHNFANAQGKFIDKIGSQDSFGRSIWALGVCQRYGTKAIKLRAEKIFHRALKNIIKLRYLRSKAYALLGLLYVSQEDEIGKISRRIANFMLKKFKKNSHKNWQFFENKLVYANAILPYALLLSYNYFPNPEYKKIGLKTLDFLNRVCRFKNLPAPIGNQGWYTQGGKKALLDPQPIDAGDMVLAAGEAFGLTKDKKYIKMMRDWFAWFFGHNIYGFIFYDRKTGGCHDGIREEKLNPDEGAESTIIFHLANLAIKKIEQKK